MNCIFVDLKGFFVFRLFLFLIRSVVVRLIFIWSLLATRFMNIWPSPSHSGGAACLAHKYIYDALSARITQAAAAADKK